MDYWILISRLLPVFILAFYQNTTFSQKAQYSFETDFCSCSGTFDSTKYSRIQLRNTFTYLWNSTYMQNDAIAWSPDDIKNVSYRKIDDECKSRLEDLNSLEFVDNDFWSKIKEERIKATESTCELMKITARAWIAPDTLYAFKTDDSLCNFYREALVDGDSKLIEAWIYLNEAMKNNNGDPQRLQRIFDQRSRSPRRLEYARQQVMTFGWWNSANHVIFS